MQSDQNKGENALYLSASVFDPIINLKCYQEREVLGESVLKYLRLTFKVFHILVTVIYYYKFILNLAIYHYIN